MSKNDAKILTISIILTLMSCGDSSSEENPSGLKGNEPTRMAAITISPSSDKNSPCDKDDISFNSGQNYQFCGFCPWDPEFRDLANMCVYCPENRCPSNNLCQQGCSDLN